MWSAEMLTEGDEIRLGLWVETVTAVTFGDDPRTVELALSRNGSTRTVTVASDLLIEMGN